MLSYIVFEYQSAEVSDTPSTTDKLHVSVYRDNAKERGGEERADKEIFNNEKLKTNTHTGNLILLQEGKGQFTLLCKILKIWL